MNQPRDPQMSGQNGAVAVDEPVVRVGGAACPRCPQAARRRRPANSRRERGRWRRASAGAWRASAPSCCGFSAGSSTELLSRELGVPVYKLERWCTKAEAGLEGALKEREADTADGELAAAMRRIGELHGERTAAREDGAPPRPFGPPEAAVMAETVSPAAGRRYGVARVCRVWDVPRSASPRVPLRRGLRSRRPGAGRSRRSPMRASSPPSERTSRARRGPERVTARSGPVCACSTASASRASGSCG